MQRRSWIGVAAASLAAAATGPASAQQAGPVVRVGDAIGDPYAQGYYANEGGFFQRGGLNVDFQSFASGVPIGQGVVTGNLEIGIMTPLAVANGVTHGVPFVMIAPGGVNSAKAPAGYLLVSKTSTLNTAKEFEGKPIGVASLRTLHELMLRSWFEKGGADQAKLSLVEMTFGEMGPAIERGTVAGAVQVEPLTSGLVNAGAVRYIAGPATAIAEEVLGGAWFCNRDYAQKNPEICRRFARVMADVARWANTHQREAGDIQARVGKIDPERVRGMARVTYAETMRVEQIQPVLDAATKFGILPRRVAASELIFR
jgi:NitT/TauT family transport system substrate-binding protein